MNNSADKMMWDAVVELNIMKLEGSIESGADMNLKSANLFPLEAVLINCSEETNNMLEITNLLLASGAMANIKKVSWYKQPLYIAAEKGFKNTVELLLKYGARKEAKKGFLGFGTTAKEIAEKKGFKEIADLIAKSE